MAGYLTATVAVGAAANAYFTGNSQLAAQIIERYMKTANLDGNGTLDVQSFRAQFGQNPQMSGSGLLVPTTKQIYPTSAQLSGGGSIAAAQFAKFTQDLNLAGAGALAANLVGQVTGVIPAALAGSGALAAGFAAAPRGYMNPNFGGDGALSAVTALAKPIRVSVGAGSVAGDSPTSPGGAKAAAQWTHNLGATPPKVIIFFMSTVDDNSTDLWTAYGGVSSHVFKINGAVVSPTFLGVGQQFSGSNARGLQTAYALWNPTQSGNCTFDLTVDPTTSGGSPTGMICNTIAYNNVGTLTFSSAGNYNPATPMTHTVTSAANRLIAQMFCQRARPITAASYNQTNLGSWASAGGGPYAVFGEAPGAASVAFSCPATTTGGSLGYGSIAVDVAA
jgi:hypothetical protein